MYRVHKHKNKKIKNKISLVQQYSSIKSTSSLLYSVISAKLCLMYNNSRITFMFENSEADNTLLFTVVKAIFLLINASSESGVPKRVAECWALRPMG